MPAPTLADMGSVIVKRGPRTLKPYFARRSWPAGMVPPHLQSYASAMGGNMRDCAAQTSGMRGNARVTAMNGCLAGKTGKGRR